MIHSSVRLEHSERFLHSPEKLVSLSSTCPKLSLQQWTGIISGRVLEAETISNSQNIDFEK